MKTMPIAAVALLPCLAAVLNGSTGLIAKPDVNTRLNASCVHGVCSKVVTYRCYCTACDDTVSGSTCPCIQDNRGRVQQTTYAGQCVKVTASVAADYEARGVGFRLGAGVSGEFQVCHYPSTPTTRVVTGPVCGS
jgi:hypothetical protein